MTTIVDLYIADANIQQPLIPSAPFAVLSYQSLVDTVSSIGQKVLNNPIVASCDSGSVIKAALIVGTGLAITGIYLGTRALFPNEVTLPYTFTGILIFGGCMICSTFLRKTD